MYVYPRSFENYCVNRAYVATCRLIVNNYMTLVKFIFVLFRPYYAPNIIYGKGNNMYVAFCNRPSLQWKIIIKSCLIDSYKFTSLERTEW